MLSWTPYELHAGENITVDVLNAIRVNLVLAHVSMEDFLVEVRTSGGQVEESPGLSSHPFKARSCEDPCDPRSHYHV